MCHAYNLRVIAPYWDTKLKVLAPSDGVLLRLLRSGNYHEYRELKFVYGLVDGSSSMIDIGANVGFWSLVLGSIAKSRSGKIYAFEPTPASFLDLRVNMLLNGFDDRSVVTIPLAVGDKDGEVVLNCYEEIGSGGGWNTIGVPYMTNSGGGLLHPRPITVNVTTLDTWWTRSERPQCEFVKIDVEGYERNVLKGASAFMAKHRSNPNFLMMMEVNRAALESAGSTVAGVWDEITALGLQVAVLNEMPHGSSTLRELRSEEFARLSSANVFLCFSVELLNRRIINGSASRYLNPT
jgi:FkbM family methyltransferase